MSQEPARRSAAVTRLRLVSYSCGSAVVMAILAGGISLIRVHSVRPLAISHTPVVMQLAGGILVGTLFGAGAVTLFLRAPVFADGRAKAREVLETSRLARADLVIMSVSAGIGEELLFRGAFQPLMGLGLSTVLFTMAHSWVPLKGSARTVYGIFVFTVSLALGSLLMFGGLIAAMVAHSVVDLVVLLVAFDRLTDARVQEV